MANSSELEPFDPRNPPSQEFCNRQDSIWLPPNPKLSKWQDIMVYATTFDGYGYANDALGVECDELANERRSEFEGAGEWRGTFAELRCCLFFEQRRHHFSNAPTLSGSEAQIVRGLHRALIAAWQGERGKAAKTQDH